MPRDAPLRLSNHRPTVWFNVRGAEQAFPAARYRTSVVSLPAHRRHSAMVLSASNAQESDAEQCAVPCSSQVLIDNDSVALPRVSDQEVSVELSTKRSRRRARVTHTGPRHPSLPSAETGEKAAAGTRDSGLPRSCGVRSRRFQVQPNVTLL